MKNSVFELEFNKEKGTLTSLYLVGDGEHADFIKDGRGLCEIHATLWHGRESDTKFLKVYEDWKLENFTEGEDEAISVFSRRGIVITERFILTDDDLRIKINVKNTNAYPVYFKREDLSFYTPFADSYDDSKTCQRVRTHAHMAPFGENSYVRVERMGISE